MTSNRSRVLIHHKQQIKVLTGVAKIEESLVHCVELVEGNHSGPFQGANHANVAVVGADGEAVGGKKIFDGVEKVCEVAEVLMFRQVVVGAVARDTKELEVLKLTGIDAG